MNMPLYLPEKTDGNLSKVPAKSNVSIPIPLKLEGRWFGYSPTPECEELKSNGRQSRYSKRFPGQGLILHMAPSPCTETHTSSSWAARS